jgi:hypothetical protein
MSERAVETNSTALSFKLRPISEYKKRVAHNGPRVFIGNAIIQAII